LNRWNIPFTYHVKYLGIIFDKRIRWRLCTEMIKAKAFRAFIRVSSLLKREQLSTNIKPSLHKAIIKSVITYACPAWEFMADTHLLKLHGLQNKVLCTTGKFLRHTPVCELQVQVPYIHNMTLTLK
jgi:hypothetical protein